MRKILYISGTRADYGLMRTVLFAIHRHPKLQLEVAATGMHLMPEFGSTIAEIKKDQFLIHRVEAVFKDDRRVSMAFFLGEFVQKLIVLLQKSRPDLILLLGDRVEMLGGAFVGLYLGIPVAHVHGGDISSTVDDTARHAITKLAQIHFPATRAAAARISAMGEEKWRIHIVGAPGLDSILHEPLPSPKILCAKYHLDRSKPLLLVMQHPVSEEVAQAGPQMRETMEAIKELGHQTIVLYPNADSGGRTMIKVIEQYQHLPHLQIYKSLPRADFLGPMKIANVLIGNSSSGIIEAPSFHIPVVNIGTRQQGRERAENIIEVGYQRAQIKRAIVKALFDNKFRLIVQRCKSPYGDGKSGKRIANILARVPLNNQLLQKRLAI